MTKPEAQLAALRQRIDALDNTIAEALIARAAVVREVAELKAQHWPAACHIRPGREGQMHQAIARRFTGTGFPPLTALSIWRQLIGGSTQIESPLAAVVIEPDHRFLAREYFGLQVSTSVAADFSQAIARVKEGIANLVILPAPDLADWWKNTQPLSETGLRIFAALPLVEGNLPAGVRPAVALAAIAPEPSGDDVSYYINQGNIERLDGFIEGRDGFFLGAHPRQIELRT